MRSRPLPGPREHLAGTLALVRRFASLAGGHPELPRVLALLDRPLDLPAVVPDEANALKYDAYLAAGDRGTAWGVTINDRHEPGALRRALAPLADAWGAALDRLEALQAALSEAAPVLTVSVGFDAPDRPPRLKLYLQEDRWGQGLATAEALAPRLAELGCRLPPWIPAQRRIGVVTLELRGGEASAKVYLGAEGAGEAAEGSPLSTLAARFGALCPLPGYHYLTVRMAPHRPARYAINKIYNPLRLAFDDPRGWRPAWEEIRGLFDAAGRADAFEAIDAAASELGRRGVAVAPTATAFEDEGRSADLYCAAWSLP